MEGLIGGEITGVLVGVTGGMVSVGDGRLLGVNTGVAVSAGANNDAGDDRLQAASRKAAMANIPILEKI